VIRSLGFLAFGAAAVIAAWRFGRAAEWAADSIASNAHARLIATENYFENARDDDDAEDRGTVH
jgi:hypothetical protein